jgi:hypothetical protein
MGLPGICAKGTRGIATQPRRYPLARQTGKRQYLRSMNRDKWAAAPAEHPFSSFHIALPGNISRLQRAGVSAGSWKVSNQLQGDAATLVGRRTIVFSGDCSARIRVSKPGLARNARCAHEASGRNPSAIEALGS